MKSRIGVVVFCLIFGIGFGAGGLFGLSRMVNLLHAWAETSNWVAVPARVLSADLRSHSSSDATTYRVEARYAYRYGGRDYVGTRIGLEERGSDNIGTWQRDQYRKLARARADGSEIEVWVNPAQPSEAIVDRGMRWEKLLFLIPFATLFPAVSLFAWWYLWKTLRRPVNEYDAAPRLARNPSVIRTDSKKGVWLVWLFAAFWNLMAFPIAGTTLVSNPAFGPHWLALLFPVVGVALLIWAIRLSWRLARFGEFSLVLQPTPASLGSRIDGRITFGKALPSHPACIVSLVCEQVDRGGEDTSYRRLWQQERQINLVGRTLAFAFEPPGNLPASEPESQVYHRWQIRMRGLGEDGINEAFDIALGPAHGRAATSPDTAARPNDATKVEIPPDVATVMQTGDGLEIDYAPRRRNAALAFVLGVPFAGAAWFLATQWGDAVTLVMAAVFGLIGAGIVVAGIHALTHRLHVAIRQDRGEARSRWLFGRKHESFSRPQVQRLMPVLASTHGTRDFFEIVALLVDGRRVTLGRGIPAGLVAQELLRQIAAALALDEARVAPVEYAATNVRETTAPVDPKKSIRARTWLVRGIGTMVLVITIVLWWSTLDGLRTDRPAATQGSPSIVESDADRWFTAMDANDLPALQAMTRQGLSVNLVSERGDTALMLAAAKGRADIVRWLIDADADVNYAIALDGHFTGRTALINATMLRHADIVRMLAQAGARVDAADKHSLAAIHYAAERCAACLKVLREHRADLELRVTANRDETPLMIAARFGQVEAIRTLIELGADVRAKDRHGENAYRWARFFKQAKAMEVLESYE